MLLAFAALSALINLLILAALPLLVYTLYHRRRSSLPYSEIRERTGLVVGEKKYIGYSVLFAVIVMAALLLKPPSLEASVGDGSAFQAFDGLGFGMSALVLALLYGVVKTGLAEELLFRGLITGSLSRRLPLVWADIVQALVFLLPHVLIVFMLPELWLLLPFIFLGSLVVGWIRIKSGSILGPWLVHGSVNVTTALSIAFRTAV